MAARFDRLGTAELDVLAMVVPDEVSRASVRDVLGARLAEEGFLADDAIVDHLQLPLEPAPDAVELAERFVARLRAYLAQGVPELP
jgi:type II secretory pathway component PulK